MICQLLNSLFVLCFEPVFFQEFCFQSAISLSAFLKVSSFNYNILKLEICISSHRDHLPLSLGILMLVDLYLQVIVQCSLLLMPSARQGGKSLMALMALVTFHNPRSLVFIFLLQMTDYFSRFVMMFPQMSQDMILELHFSVDYLLEKMLLSLTNCVTFHDLCISKGDWIDPV